MNDQLQYELIQAKVPLQSRQIQRLMFKSHLRIWYVKNLLRSCSILNLDNSLLDIFNILLDVIVNSFDSLRSKEISIQEVNITNTNKFGDGDEENDYAGI